MLNVRLMYSYSGINPLILDRYQISMFHIGKLDYCLSKFDGNRRKIVRKIRKPFENHWKIIGNILDNKNPISSNFDPSNFHHYIIIGTHHTSLIKGFWSTNFRVFCASRKLSPKCPYSLLCAFIWNAQDLDKYCWKKKCII